MASCTCWAMIIRATPRLRRWSRVSASFSPAWASPIPMQGTSVFRTTQATIPMSRNTRTAMADETAPPGEARKRPSASFGKLLLALGLGGARRPAEQPEELGPEASAASAALRSQAEAFQTITVGDVMTPRADITAVELSAAFEAVVAAFADSEHSRLPVYKDSLD